MSEGGQRGTGDDYVLSFFSFIIPRGVVRGEGKWMWGSTTLKLLEELEMAPSSSRGWCGELCPTKTWPRGVHRNGLNLPPDHLLDFPVVFFFLCCRYETYSQVMTFDL